MDAEVKTHLWNAIKKKRNLHDVTLLYIYYILRESNFNRSKAARKLKISIRSLRVYLHVMRFNGFDVQENEAYPIKKGYNFDTSNTAVLVNKKY